MDKIDIMLEQWIKNSIVRKQLRDLIVVVIEKERTKERLKMLKWDSQLKIKK
jgi:enterochelin esterase-like enzyme